METKKRKTKPVEIQLHADGAWVTQGTALSTQEALDWLSDADNVMAGGKYRVVTIQHEGTADVQTVAKVRFS